jgi:hypothetical protein
LPIRRAGTASDPKPTIAEGVFMRAVRRGLAALAATMMAVVASLVVGVSPASAAGWDCRTWYTVGGWEARPCINTLRFLNGAGTIMAHTEVREYPSDCFRFRTYIVDAWEVERFATGKWACTINDIRSIEVEVWNGSVTTSHVKARFRAWNSSGGQILSMDSPWVSII